MSGPSEADVRRAAKEAAAREAEREQEIAADERALSAGEYACDACEVSFADELVLWLHIEWGHGGVSDGE